MEPIRVKSTGSDKSHLNESGIYIDGATMFYVFYVVCGFYKT